MELSEFTKAMQMLAPRVKDGSTRINGKKERAWLGFGVKDLEQMEQMEQDFIPAKNGAQSILLQNGNGVPSVPSVPSVPPKNCGNCANFRVANCQSEAWETRNGNAKPLTNCFHRFLARFFPCPYRRTCELYDYDGECNTINHTRCGRYKDRMYGPVIVKVTVPSASTLKKRVWRKLNID